MGTRGAWGFYNNGKTLATYNHWDSYPTGLGEKIHKFLQNNEISKIKEVADGLVPVNAQDTPSVEDHIKLGKYRDSDVNGNADEWYNLLRDVQGNPQAYVDNPDLHAFIDSTDFLQDSLFCEWAYIINLDEGCLEIYQGFQTKPPKDSRYYDEAVFKSRSNIDETFYPVGAITIVPFETLNEFSMQKFEESIYNEDE